MKQTILLAILLIHTSPLLADCDETFYPPAQRLGDGDIDLIDTYRDEWIALPVPESTKTIMLSRFNYALELKKLLNQSLEGELSGQQLSELVRCLLSPDFVDVSTPKLIHDFLNKKY